jgi:hypothetical protein
MKLTEVVLFIVLLTFISCDDHESPLGDMENEIVGDWLLVSEKQKLNSYAVHENDAGLTSNWDITISNIGSIGLKSDNSLNINHYGIDNVPPTGTWDLNGSTLTFFTEVEYVGIIFRDTIQFHVSIENQQLVLENKKLLLKHKRLD